jgi:hypothetical protein
MLTKSQGQSKTLLEEAQGTTAEVQEAQVRRNGAHETYAY